MRHARRAIRGAATYPPGVRVVDKGGAAGEEAVEEQAKGKRRLLVAHNQATRRVAETVENLGRLRNEEGDEGGGKGARGFRFRVNSRMQAQRNRPVRLAKHKQATPRRPRHARHALWATLPSMRRSFDIGCLRAKGHDWWEWLPHLRMINKYTQRLQARLIPFGVAELCAAKVAENQTLVAGAVDSNLATHGPRGASIECMRAVRMARSSTKHP